MSIRRPALWGLAAVVLAAAGCGGVDRRFVVESNVPNAQVTIDQRRVGPAPAHAPFEYYGCYTITVSHPDFETEVQRIDVAAPWHAYPPFDLLTEVFWPFRIEDVRRYYVPLRPARRPDVGEIVTAADALRERGHNLPPPPDPAPVPPPPPQPTGPPIGPPVLPPPGPAMLPPQTPVPGPSPLVPSVQPPR